jgi:hypothetical protein
VTELRIRPPVECVIAVNDEEIGALYPLLRSVEVRTSRDAASTCRLRFRTFRNEHGEWFIEDGGYFLPWWRLRVEARFGSYREEVFRGFIREIEADHPQDMGASSVAVIAQDESLQLDREHVRRVWSTEDTQLTDGQIAREIADRHGLASEVDVGRRGDPDRALLARLAAGGALGPDGHAPHGTRVRAWT